MAYCVYCMRPKGALRSKRNTPSRVCSKWLITELAAQKMCGTFEFKRQSAVAATVSQSTVYLQYG